MNLLKHLIFGSIFFGVTVFSSLEVKADWKQPIIVYYPAYSGSGSIGNIAWSLINQINIAFAGISPNGECGWYNVDGTQNSDANTLISVVNNLKAARSKSSNPNVKLVLSVGGDKAAGFSQAAASNPSRLAQSCVDFISLYGLDGIDYDWEYPGVFDTNSCPASMSPCKRSADKANFTTLLAATKSLLQGKILSAAVYVTPSENYLTYDFAGLQQNLSQVNIMAYDAIYSDAGTSTNTAYNASLTVAKNALNYYAGKGVDRQKLILGLPFYSYKWTRVPAPGSLGAASDGTKAVQVPYKQVVSDWKSAPGCTTSTATNGSYIYCSASSSHPQDWLSLDTPDMMAKKGAFVSGNGFGGLMVWVFGQDDSQNSLLRAARYGLSNGAFTSALE